MNPQNFQNFDFTKAEDVTCKNCGSNVYETVVTLKKIPANLSPTGQSAVVPIPVFKMLFLRRDEYRILSAEII